MLRVRAPSPAPKRLLKIQAITAFEPSEEISEGVFVSEKSQENSAPKVKVGSKVGNYLSPAKAAKMLGVTERTVRTWCESGALIATSKPYGRKIRWEISREAVELLLFKAREESLLVPKGLKQQQKKEIPHAELVNPWVKAMAQGLITGKPFSKSVIDDYAEVYVKPFIAKYGTLTLTNFTKEFVSIPVERFSSREHLYKAILCFGKYLFKQGAIDEEFLGNLRELKPKRHLPPQRTVVDTEGIDKLLGVCDTPLDKLIIILLSSTGLRATEACELKLDDIDLAKRYLVVRIGKGGKTRMVGLTENCVQAIIEYRESKLGSSKRCPYLLKDKDGWQMCRNGLYQRIERLGKLADVKVSPHALRRAFVTINANKGRPLQMLQMACGHSDIKTTMSYCRTTEQEVIDAMKGWD